MRSPQLAGSRSPATASATLTAARGALPPTDLARSVRGGDSSDCANLPSGDAIASAPRLVGGGGVGRPFLVEGDERLATIELRQDWCQEIAVDVRHLSAGERRRLGAEWQRIGLMEHASIAAFARFSLHLLALGAPAELLVAAQRAMQDETLHAKLAFGIAAQYGGESTGPGALDVSQALDQAGAEAVVMMTVLEGCIGETIAALEAVEALAAVRDPALRGVITMIARDEQQHAELAWRFVRWALVQHGVLRGSVHARIAAELVSARAAVAGSSPDPASDWLMRHGLISEPRRRELRVQVLTDVVVPSFDALRATLDAASIAA